MDNDLYNQRSMSQKIFETGLDTNTISLYLLCCGIADTGAAVTKENLLGPWNNTPDALDTAIGVLEDIRIISKKDGAFLADNDNSLAWHINAPDHWEI
ncbi:hypothetical protein QUF76_03390 [Desulfobacterales bacterium HSG16]|nr:hypothetical protein [Desulfobacterales bacterium HSG16]